MYVPSQPLQEAAKATWAMAIKVGWKGEVKSVLQEIISLLEQSEAAQPQIKAQQLLYEVLSAFRFQHCGTEQEKVHIGGKLELLLQNEELNIDKFSKWM